MAALPEDNTPRFRVGYTCGGVQHTLQIRSLGSPGAIGAFIGGFFTALGTASFTKVIGTTEWAPAGSNVFNPVVTGIEGNSYGAGTPVGADRAWALNFIGRTSGGRRVRIMVFCPTLLTTDYRFIAGEAALVDAARSNLVSAGSLVLGIDGLAPVWKAYVNSLVNAYWQKELRP